MDIIQQYIEKLSKITENDLEQILLDIFQKHEKELLDMERSRLLTGLDAKGKFIKPPYRNDSYANFKLTLNPLGVVDLTLTGAFTGDFIMSATTFPIFFGSLDEKSYNIIQKYGEDVFGESEEDLETARQGFILSDYQNRLQELLGL